MKENKRKRVDPVRWPGVYQYELGIKHLGRPDVAYYITYKDGAKKIWEKVGNRSEGMTPQIADDIRKDRTFKARHGDEVLTAKQIKAKKARTNRPLDEIADAYFGQRGGSPQAAKYDRYRYNKHVKPIIGNRPVSSLTALDMKRIEKAMDGAAPATVWGALELVRRMANFGKKARLCGGLTFKIDMPNRDNELTEFLTPEQASALLQTLDLWPHQDVARMLKVAMFSGLRRGEIFKLEDQDLDFGNKLIRLRSPKGGRTVSVPLNPVVEQIIKEQIEWRNERHPGSPLLFPGRDGALRVECTAIDRIRKAAALPHRFRMFHGLRHHYAVTLANSGEFTLDMIGELLTHKSHEMTKRYAKFLPGSLQKAGNLAAKLIQGHALGKKPKENIKTGTEI